MSILTFNKSTNAINVWFDDIKMVVISQRLKAELTDLTFGNINERQHIFETRIAFYRV
jgi:hypothetical protein